MTVWTLYLSKPGTAQLGSAAAFAAPVAQGLTIDDTNILTVNPGLLGPGPSSVSTKALYLGRFLRNLQGSANGRSNGYRFLLSSDGGTTFIAADE